jgi:hypothetical protein
MEKVIDPIDRSLIEKELTSDRFLRYTNNGGNEIYIVNYHNSPNILMEIGRLRELSFRDAGGGTGLSCDIDEFDTCETPYQQLLVWNPEDKEIVGGYRFIHCSLVSKDEFGQPKLATAELFNFSEQFIKVYSHSTIELGRSWVQPLYQPTIDFRKGMYSLDNLWDGLGAVVIEYPDLKYYFGKITMYPKYNKTARDLIHFFMQKYFMDTEQLVVPHIKIEINTDLNLLKNTFNANNYKDDYKILVQEVRKYNENIPPLVNAYMNLSATMKYFGAATNQHFGAVEESAILIAIDDIYDIKKDRHLSSYKKDAN